MLGGPKFGNFGGWAPIFRTRVNLCVFVCVCIKMFQCLDTQHDYIWLILLQTLVKCNDLIATRTQNLVMDEMSKLTVKDFVRENKNLVCENKNCRTVRQAMKRSLCSMNRRISNVCKSWCEIKCTAQMTRDIHCTIIYSWSGNGHGEPSEYIESIWSDFKRKVPSSNLESNELFSFEW